MPSYQRISRRSAASARNHAGYPRRFSRSKIRQITRQALSPQPGQFELEVEAPIALPTRSVQAPDEANAATPPATIGMRQVPLQAAHRAQSQRSRGLTMKSAA